MSPEFVGLQPFRTRQLGRAVDAKPVRRIMRGDFAFGPLDVKGAEHGKIGTDVRCVGIEQRAVPIEQDGARGTLDDFQDVGIVSEGDVADKRLGAIATGERRSKNHVNYLTQRSQRKACRVRRESLPLGGLPLRAIPQGDRLR